MKNSIRSVYYGIVLGMTMFAPNDEIPRRLLIFISRYILLELGW